MIEDDPKTASADEAAGPDDAPSAATPEEEAKATRRRVIIGLGGTILVLAVVFWFIFSFIIDPEIVVDAFLSLSLLQLGVLAVMAAGTYVLLGITLKTTLGGLGFKDATLGTTLNMFITRRIV